MALRGGTRAHGTRQDGARAALVEQALADAMFAGNTPRVPPPLIEGDKQSWLPDGRSAIAEAASSVVADAVHARDESYPNYAAPAPLGGSSKPEPANAPRAPTKLRWYSKLAYAMPELSKLSVTMLMNVHAIAFFNEYGADLSTLSFLVALARSLDVLTDPLMGWLTDSTRSRFGRRRVYMLFFAPLYAGCLIALLSAGAVFAKDAEPEARAAGLAGWFCVFYTSLYLCDTGANVPHSALGPELTDDPRERNSVFFLAGLFKMAGILLAAITPVAVQYQLGSELGCETAEALESTSWPPCDLIAKGRGLQVTALFLAAWYVFSIAVACAVVRERPASVSHLTPPLVPSLMATLRNGPFMKLLPTWVLDQLSTTLVTTMLLYFYTYVVQPHMTVECAAECTLDARGAAWYAAQPVKDERGRNTKSVWAPGCRSPFWCGVSGWIGLSIVVLIVGAVLSQPLWLLLTRWIEKRNVWLLFNVVNSVTALLFVAVDEGDPVLCVLVVFLNGIPLGAQFLTESIVADVIDYDEFLTGVRSEGRFTIGQSLLPKMVSVPAGTVPLTLLVLLGFVPPDAQGRPQPQAPIVTTFIRVVFFGLPFACCVLSCALKLRFPLRTEMIRRQVREGCALHMRGLPAIDPLTNRVTQPIELLPDEQVEQWRLDHFYLKQLEQLYMRGPKPLIRRMRRNRRQSALSLVVFVALCATGLGEGWIRTQMLAWICTFSAIGAGLSLCMLLLAQARLRAALDLQRRPVNKVSAHWLLLRGCSFSPRATRAPLLPPLPPAPAARWRRPGRSLCELRLLSPDA
jgi:Na+/melibiose symporter-like transporter